MLKGSIRSGCPVLMEHGGALAYSPADTVLCAVLERAGVASVRNLCAVDDKKKKALKWLNKKRNSLLMEMKKLIEIY